MPGRNLNTLCIFCLYDKEGVVDDYVFCLIKELRTYSTRLFVVVNGSIQRPYRELIIELSDDYLERDNQGFDAGAYYDVLLNEIMRDELERYNEIILCNDTFFGFFGGLEKVFSEMDQRECDFWGLSGHIQSLFPYIQSYFMVFRKGIIKENLLVSYFEKYVDSTSDNLNDVYAQFEKGIFDYLTRKKGKRYSIYVEPQEYSVYNSAIYYLSEKGLPILKTKVFDSSKYPSLYHMRCCIKYVLHYTSYNVDYILRHIKRKYNIEFTQDEIESVDLTKLPEKYKIFEPRNSAEEILNFVGNDRFYIYGTGMFGSMLYWRIGLNNPMFLGFIVSDYQFCDEAKYEHRIYKFSEIEDVVSAKIVIATNAEIAKEIIKQFPNRNNLIQIY